MDSTTKINEILHNGDFVKKLWERLRTQKLEMITQLELPLADQAAYEHLPAAPSWKTFESFHYSRDAAQQSKQ